MIAHKSNRTLLELMYSDYRQLWLITILWGKRGSFAVFVRWLSNTRKGRGAGHFPSVQAVMLQEKHVAWLRY